MIKNILREMGYWFVRENYSLPKFNSGKRINELTRLRNLLNGLDVNVVFDVGANKGTYSESLRKIGYEGYIFSFEPLEQDFNIIKQKAKSDPKWMVVPKAVGESSGVIEINVIKVGPTGRTVFSSILNPLTLKSDETVEVEIISLDQVADQLLSNIDSPRIFLKSDTQGYDMHVWNGAKENHPRIVGLQAEVSVTAIYNGQPHYLDSLRVFEDAGFTLASLDLVNRNKYGGILEYDCIMFRSEALSGKLKL